MMLLARQQQQRHALTTRATRSLVARGFLATRTTPNKAATAERSSSSSSSNEDESSSLLPKPPQSFVKARFSPGEWDAARTNPLHRPRYTSNAKILSADDFATRPKAGTSVEFESFTDAMVTLSWLSQREQAHIYQVYCDIMLSSSAASAANNNNKKSETSHEYAMRVVASRFRLTATRVAAVVQLQHNEQQLRRQGVQLADDVADYMDHAIQQEIAAAYASQNQRPPASFVEDPVGVTEANRPLKAYVAADDVVDVAQLWPQTRKQEDVQAQAFLDQYQYAVDQEPNTVTAPADDDCLALVKQAQRLRQQSAETKNNNANNINKNKNKKPANRWKFMAQTVNTRQLKKQQHTKKASRSSSSKSYTNNNPRNTLVSDVDGNLRVATAAETAAVDWKAARQTDQFIYGPVQQAWLQRQHQDDLEAWGKAPPAAVVEETKQETTKAAADEAETAADDETSSADVEASGTEEGTSAAEEEEAVTEKDLATDEESSVNKPEENPKE